MRTSITKLNLYAEANGSNDQDNIFAKLQVMLDEQNAALAALSSIIDTAISSNSQQAYISAVFLAKQRLDAVFEIQRFLLDD